MNQLFKSMCAVAATFVYAGTALGQANITDLLENAKAEQEMQRALDSERQQVEELYSTEPRRVILADREYEIPANFFGPKERDQPEVFVATDGGFGFVLFQPNYGGYTKENWEDQFDPRLIKIMQVKRINKNETERLSDGKSRRVLASSYGDPKARFELLSRRYEGTPSLDMFELRGYRRKGHSSGVLWTGTRTNGEFFFIQASLAPGEPVRPGITFPVCEVRYYSEKEQLFIAYRYSQANIASWREIDDAIWNKLHSWLKK